MLPAAACARNRIGRGYGVELLGERQGGRELRATPVIKRQPIGDAEDRGRAGQGAAGVVGPALHGPELRAAGAAHDHVRGAEHRQQTEFGPAPRLVVRLVRERIEARLKQGRRLLGAAAADRGAAGAQPPGRRLERLAGRGQVAGDHFRLALAFFKEVRHQAMGDAGVQVAPLAPENRGVGRVLDQGVLEQEGTAACARLDQARLQHRLQRLLESLVRLLDHRRQQGAENDRPITEPTCMNNRAGPRLSRRAVRRSESVSGKSARRARSGASSIMRVISSTNSGMPSVRLTIRSMSMDERPAPRPIDLGETRGNRQASGVRDARRSRRCAQPMRGRLPGRVVATSRRRASSLNSTS